MSLASEIEHSSNLLWLGAEAQLTEAREDKGDLTWHIPLLLSSKHPTDYLQMHTIFNSETIHLILSLLRAILSKMTKPFFMLIPLILCPCSCIVSGFVFSLLLNNPAQQVPILSGQ